jgi:hypothetical protein
LDAVLTATPARAATSTIVTRSVRGKPMAAHLLEAVLTPV